MNNVVRFSGTALSGTGKKGVMTPDADGYYTQVLGGMNVHNSVNEFYVYEQAKSLFDRNSNFMRRISDGVLKCEVGHPVMEPGMTEQQYIRRILTIRETNVCAFIKEIELDFDNYRDKTGAPMVAIIGKIAPTGPFGPALREALERPGENVCFSIRSFTEDYLQRGKCMRILREVVTFDWVTEPGIHIAKKFNSPGLEQFDLGSMNITRRMLEEIVAKTPQSGVGLESSNAQVQQLIKTLGWKEPAHGGKPAFTRW